MLKKAKTDKRITGVMLKPSGAGALWGKVQEVRDAVTDFRRSGKPIIAFLEYGGEQEFYLATACDKVFLLPTARSISPASPATSSSCAACSTRSAPIPTRCTSANTRRYSNTFTQHTYTPAHREMAESLNNDLSSSWCAASPTAARRAKRT